MIDFRSWISDLPGGRQVADCAPGRQICEWQVSPGRQELPIGALVQGVHRLRGDVARAG